jgi:hypothetical protein
MDTMVSTLKEVQDLNLSLLRQARYIAINSDAKDLEGLFGFHTSVAEHFTQISENALVAFSQHACSLFSLNKAAKSRLSFLLSQDYAPSLTQPFSLNCDYRLSPLLGNYITSVKSSALIDFSETLVRYDLPAELVKKIVETDFGTLLHILISVNTTFLVRAQFFDLLENDPQKQSILRLRRMVKMTSSSLNN